MTDYYDKKINENEHLKKLVDTYMSTSDSGDGSKICDPTDDSIEYTTCYNTQLGKLDYKSLKSLVDEYLEHEKEELHKRERVLHLKDQNNSALTDMGRYRYHYVAWTLASVIVVIVGLRLYK